MIRCGAATPPGHLRLPGKHAAKFPYPIGGDFGVIIDEKEDLAARHPNRIVPLRTQTGARCFEITNVDCCVSSGELIYCAPGEFILTGVPHDNLKIRCVLRSQRG